MDKYIVDGMKKEAKWYIFLTFFGYIVSILSFVNAYIQDKSLTDESHLLIFIFGLLFGSIGLYGWLYSFKYSLEITEEKILLKTLFGKKGIHFKDIIYYTCSRYRKSVFYQFNLFTEEKKILINTRYREDLETMLKNKNINCR